jgi:hypothetical protein
MKLKLSDRLSAAPDVLFQQVDGESVLLNLASESYFGLDPVGTRVWLLLGEDSSLQRAFDALRAEYEVEPDRLEGDLLALAQSLVDAGLLQPA